MCGRFLLLSSGDTLVAHFRLAEKFQSRPRYNVAPSRPVLTVGLTKDGRPAAAQFRWGLVPSWSPDTRKAPINARSETVAYRETFSGALRERRCLVPADGFYEWEQLPNRRKRPWVFRLKAGGPFAFAGLWDFWRAPSGPPLYTCAVLTTAANDTVRPVHGRMPVILPPEHYAAWLDRAITDPAALLPQLRPFPADAMTATPLGPAVNDPRNDGPECLAPA